MVDVLPGCEPMSVAGGAGGVLALHGFTGNPLSLRPLAERLAGAGLAVELPRLPGHGTLIDDLLDKTWGDWTATALAAYDDLAARAGRVAVVGFSMGGALTAFVAQRRDVAGCVFINPLVKPVEQPLLELLDDALAQGTAVFDTDATSDVKRPGLSGLAYAGWPLVALRSLMDGLVELRAHLADITAPSLILTSREDHTVTTDNSDELAGALSGPVERLWLEDSYHYATLDFDRERVEAEALAFVQRVLS